MAAPPDARRAGRGRLRGSDGSCRGDRRRALGAGRRDAGPRRRPGGPPPRSDRVVFEYTGRGPTSSTVKYVTTLVADASARTVPVAVGRSVGGHARRGQPHDGRDGHDAARQAFALKNVTLDRAVGRLRGRRLVRHRAARRRRAFRTTAVGPGPGGRRHHDAFTTVNRRVWFADSDKVAAKRRDADHVGVAPGAAHDAGDRGHGPALRRSDEGREGGRLCPAGLGVPPAATTCGSPRTDRPGAVTGPCGDGSAVVTVADEIVPSLRQVLDRGPREGVRAGRQDRVPDRAPRLRPGVPRAVGARAAGARATVSRSPPGAGRACRSCVVTTCGRHRRDRRDRPRPVRWP